jgi:hypothetical protein
VYFLEACLKSKITRTKYDNKWIFNCILGASLILLVVVGLNLTNAFAKSSEVKGVESANNNADIKIPPVKLSYGGHASICYGGRGSSQEIEFSPASR